MTIVALPFSLIQHGVVSALPDRRDLRLTADQALPSASELMISQPRVEVNQETRGQEPT
jgi:hypothetical protein